MEDQARSGTSGGRRGDGHGLLYMNQGAQTLLALFQKKSLNTKRPGDPGAVALSRRQCALKQTQVLFLPGQRPPVMWKVLVSGPKTVQALGAKRTGF